MTGAITAIYAALLALLAIGLAGRVVVLRRRLRVGLGTGGEYELERAVRAHANLMEYAPLAILLILLLEMSGARAVSLHALGALTVVGRLLHGWGLSRKSGVSFGRFYGTAITWAVIIVAACALLVTALTG